MQAPDEGPYGLAVGDLLAFTVATPEGAYPSVDVMFGSSHRGGLKTKEYHELARRVRHAARIAMIAANWTTANSLVEVHWKRFVTNRRRGGDAANGLKCELDAMQPHSPTERERERGETDFAGVYINDNLVRPFPDHPMLDTTPGAIDRVSIVVMRLFPAVALARNAPAAPTQSRPKAARPKLEPYRGGPIPEGFAVRGGFLVPHAEVRSEILAALARH
ncbi:MAG TPA: hypothetical protein VNF68_00655 [Candidatus Baltobacteraceae bacterium]|jgi:hypothetical protein|nr:hypothetical protein [Candidatus Baltobacteraceae bacterium]